MDIIRGKLPSKKKVVIYGPEGVGKSTLASKFPDPVFIDTEGSTKDMDVGRLPAASSWQMILQQIDYIKNNPTICKTLVIDTIDWAEQMCVEDICNKHQKTGIEDFGYGNGYVYVKEEFGRFLNHLEEVVKAGVNVVLTAHAQIRKFEQPDELGAYDRYELKLGKKTSSQTSPIVKEWADMILFCNYKIMSVSVDDKGKKHKAQGGRRVMYTSHHPCWDAKNRYDLPDELPLDYASIAPIIEQGTPSTPTVHTPPPPNKQIPLPGTSVPSKQENIPPSNTGEQMDLPLDENSGKEIPPFSNPDPQIPKALRDLMVANKIDEWEIQNAVSARGYFPSDMPVRDYPSEFIGGVLVGAWAQVHDMIKDARKNMEIPFN